MDLLFFSLCWILSVVSVSLSLDLTSRAVQLSVAEQSVDDMYEGCRAEMGQRVHETYFPREIKTDFRSVWDTTLVKNCVNGSKENLQDPALTENQLQAICVYTSNKNGKFYEKFNDHVRNNKSIYGSYFKYHSLHFWLTSAVQILNKNKCHTTYRRTNLEFTGSVGQKMRFGFFASSSYKTTLDEFGKKTCFRITTCSGADLKLYSAVEHQEEVLIPPYEVFRVTERTTGSAVKGLEDCEVVYMLENQGYNSILNCKAGSWSTAAFSVPPLLVFLSAVLSIYTSPT